MLKLLVFTLLSILLSRPQASEALDDYLGVLSPNFQAHIATVGFDGETVFRTVDDLDPNRKVEGPTFAPLGNISRDVTRQNVAGVPNIVELVIVVDKDFNDLFNRDYWKIVDYLAVYFWDINLRFKSLPGVDISFRLNSLLTMESAAAQPFVENGRNSQGKPDFNKVLSLFGTWMYAQRSWLGPHDLATLIMAADVAWGGGLAIMDGACWLDDAGKHENSVAVWNDDGRWASLTVAAHEIGHTLGLPHDDDSSVNCPDMGFIMGGGNNDRRYLFSECSNQKMTAFITSNSASCLRSITGYATTPMDSTFSNTKAPDVAEQCRRWRKDPNAWVDAKDINCKESICKWKDPVKPNVMYYQGFNPVDNSVCSNGGRCFRGRCRKESQLLRNEKSGKCMYTTDRFGRMIQARMGPCPTSKERTPLQTIEVLDGPNGKMLSTPYLEDRNKVNADRCFYTGVGDGGQIWTDTCSKDNPWHGWDFRPIGDKFQLVHRVTGRCAVPDNGNDGSAISTFACSGTNDGMTWTWTNGK